MAAGAFGVEPFSAVVDLRFECEHGHVPLSHVASESIIAAAPRELPAQCHGRVVVSVDGREFVRPVMLVDGMSVARPEARVVALKDGLPF